jgi:hypothetical protein
MIKPIIFKWLIWMIAINTLTLLANNFLITIMMGWFDSPFG